MTEYRTNIQTSQSRTSRDWLSVCGIFGIALGLLFQAAGAYLNHAASMEYWKATDRMANRLEHQIAITGQAYKLAVDHYTPKLDQSNLVESPPVDPSESPFPE